MLRLEYLFLLGHVCHVDPAQSWRMSVLDFGRLIDGIDGWVETRKQAASQVIALGEQE